MARTEDKNILELINTVTEINDLCEFMKDEQFDRAMHDVIKLILRPDVPSAKAPQLIVELQALSAKFAMMSVLYTTIKKDRAGTENNYKKNIYYTARECLDRIVDALKYSARLGA